ncbi:hypothetical protein CERSUDRAFT_78412 [Gelatoporia subvermispora B]|uniref:Uncharacterized protein n=1 Tax=Ceriporiopsis subvermispora (strain B) TaxID=914234 RepID=M2QGB5_CERS8|nr:hypothetical protein CERSUDRAFT_78412 [Gelatoporia subvermispora B]
MQQGACAIGARVPVRGRTRDNVGREPSEVLAANENGIDAPLGVCVELQSAAAWRGREGKRALYVDCLQIARLAVAIRLGWGWIVRRLGLQCLPRVALEPLVQLDGLISPHSPDRSCIALRSRRAANTMKASEAVHMSDEVSFEQAREEGLATCKRKPRSSSVRQILPS